MKKLGWFTVGFTYLLMVWGNMVSATGSGLGCPDWPRCHGTFFPPATFETILEWGHRLLALATTILIVLTIAQVLLSRGSYGNALKRSGKFLLLLLGVQIVLGGITVILGLSIFVSTIHLVIANLVMGGLISVASVMTWGDPVITQNQKMRKLAVFGLGGLLIQLALGALVRHSHSGLACPMFPGCLDGFWPVPFTFGTAVAFFHRWWGVCMIGLYFHLTSVSWKKAKPLRLASSIAFVLACAQIGLGIATVLGGLGTAMRGLHAAGGYALWAFTFYISIRSGSFGFLYGRR